MLPISKVLLRIILTIFPHKRDPLYYLLFILYFILSGVLLTKSRFIASTGLSKKEILCLFVLKLGAGFVYLRWILFAYPGTNDYEILNGYGQEEYALLLDNPLQFIKSVFHSHYAEYGNFFGSFHSFWNDLRVNIIAKFLGIANIFTQGNIFLNTLFFCSFSFFAHMALFKIFHSIYPQKKWPILLTTLAIPSLLYASTLPGKDSVTFILLCFACYSLHLLLKQGFSFKHFVSFIVSAILLLLIRNFVFLLLVPGFVAWIWTEKKRITTGKIFVLVYAFIFILIAMSAGWQNPLSPYEIIKAKQKDFAALEGTTTISMDTLQPGIQSMAWQSLKSVNRVIMRPYLWESYSSPLIFPALEMICIQILLLIFLFYGNKAALFKNPFIYFSLFFSISILFFIGFIVPNLGAINRYRSIYLPFLLTPFSCVIRWKNLPIFKYINF